MTPKKFFLGYDPGPRVEKSVGCIMSVDGHQIGVLKSFDVREKRETQPIFKMREGTVEFPKSVAYKLSVSHMWIDEERLRATILDSERDDAPPREVTP